MGSSGFPDRALDLRVNYKGIYMLAEIGSMFCIEGTCNNNQQVWDTKFNLVPNLALILIKYGSSSLDIVEIEVRFVKIILIFI